MVRLDEVLADHPIACDEIEIARLTGSAVKFLSARRGSPISFNFATEDVSSRLSNGRLPG
jgi:hypothetical protein